MGIAIIPSLAFDRHKDRNIGSRSLGALFEPTNACALLRRGLRLRGYMYDFLALLSPNLDQKSVDKAIYSPPPLSDV